jgi:hypothetical protein
LKPKIKERGRRNHKHNSEISQRKNFNKKKLLKPLPFSNLREQIFSKPPLQSITSQTKSNTN